MAPRTYTLSVGDTVEIVDRSSFFYRHHAVVCVLKVSGRSVKSVDLGAMPTTYYAFIDVQLSYVEDCNTSLSYYRVWKVDQIQPVPKMQVKAVEEGTV